MAVLDEVRGELNSSFPHRPGDAERVSRALCQALQILNCLHPCRGTSCRRHDQRSSWAYSRSLSGSTSTQVSDSSFNHHDGAGETGKTLLGAGELFPPWRFSVGSRVCNHTTEPNTNFQSSYSTVSSTFFQSSRDVPLGTHLFSFF